MSERLHSGVIKVDDIAGFSIASDKHPERNEDSFFIDSENAAIGVFDGMGGHAGSEWASRTAAHVVAEHLHNAPMVLPHKLGRKAVYDALIAGHQAIVKGNKGDIGTTAAVAKLFNDGTVPYAVIGHVGDSRAYLMHQGVFSRLTLDNVDQTYENYSSDDRLRDASAWRMQEILSRVTQMSQLDEKAQREFRRRNVITSCLGDYGRLPNIAVSDLHAVSGDCLVVTSDGVHDNLTTNEIAWIILEAESAGSMTDNLVHGALVRSRRRGYLRAKPDDITAVALTV